MSEPTRPPDQPAGNPVGDSAARVTSATAPIEADEEQQLLAALRRGAEDAFMRLVDRYHAALLRLAQIYVRDRSVAEEVVQETWLAVLQGLDRFEGRSSLKTWIFRILANKAKTRAQREGRSVPFSSLPDPEAEGDEPAVEPERFLPGDDPQRPHAWASPPRHWDELPEQRLLSDETLAQVQQAIEALPEQQRTVIRLRDVEGCAADEVCNILGISETNQRVLLHRARAKVRRALEQYLGGG
jgi:RNA polymerase sigma-70 factor, ECF subfamily